MSNALRVIFPYRQQGQWMFDDAATGLNREPFVFGIDTMLDLLSYRAGIRRGLSKGVKLLFSHLPFPGATELVWDREDVGGNWYRCKDLEDSEGWLCPALFKYFPEAPKRLYIKVERKVASSGAESSATRRRAGSPSRRSRPRAKAAVVAD